MAILKKILTGDNELNRHVAIIRGEKYHDRPYYYINKKTGVKYSHITGGIAWPQYQVPGFLLVVGVSDADPVKMDCLDEFETDNDQELYKTCKGLQEKYGSRQYPDIISTWWGDQEKLLSLVSERNIKRDNAVTITHPPDWDQKDKFAVYLSRLRTSLRPTNKVLNLNECVALRNHILAFQEEKNSNIENTPAVAMAGWLVHALMVYRPWEKTVQRERLFSHAASYFEREQELTDKYLYAGAKNG